MNKFFILCLFLTVTSFAISPGKNAPPPSKEETAPQVTTKIEIKPTARDFEIEERLQAIIEATGWFNHPSVEVKEGVVFLSGEAKNEETKKWASELARNTQDVSAVVNKMKIQIPSLWDFHPVIDGLQKFGRDLVKIIPLIFFAFIIFGITWFFVWLITRFARKILSSNISSPLLLEVILKGMGFCVFVFGFYIIFKVMGLTTVAFTLIGGTGVLGIILGIAFRDITENLLASILLSIHHPFQKGDLIEIMGILGYVQKLTIRSTIIMGVDGTYHQIPNSTIYKNIIRNFSVNSNRQENFTIGIGYNEAIPEAQEIALKILAEHPAVLKDPEPWVLVDFLDKNAVVLKIYFWLDGSKHSWLKVKSSVMRLIKVAFQTHKISMPGEIRELLFKNEIPVKMLEAEKKLAKEESLEKEKAPIATASEAELKSESEDIKEQAKQVRAPAKGEENLLS